MTQKEYRQKLAEEFVHLLEEKDLEWKKEWTGRDGPFNAKSCKAYKGSNRFYLSLIAAARKYKDPRWATFRQIQDAGWSLKNAKGQGVKIEYWYPYDLEKKKSITWQEFRESGEGIGNRYHLYAKYFVVFNAELIDGIPPYERETPNVAVDELVSRLSANMEVEIRNDGGGQAFYSVSDDMIHLPRQSDFTSTYAYNSTALHELTHATGARHRLNRNIKTFLVRRSMHLKNWSQRSVLVLCHHIYRRGRMNSTLKTIRHMYRIGSKLFGKNRKR